MSEAKQNNRTFRLKVWQMVLLPIILALIPFLYPEVKALFMRKLPQFVIEDPIISKGDSVLHIFAENSPARKKEDLNIEVEGLEFRDAGRLVREDPLEWEFIFTRYDIPETLFSEGINTIKIGFPSNVGYDELNVYVRPDFYQEETVATGQDLVPRVSSVDTSTIGMLDREVKQVYISSTIKSDDERVGVVKSALQGQGINAKGVSGRIHPHDAEVSQVRYFHPKDKKKAKAFSEMLKKDLAIDAKVVNIGDKLPEKAAAESQGVLEIVLTKPVKE